MVTAPPVHPIRNGVDTATMFGTLDLLKQQPELGHFVFRAHNEWVDGAHNRSTIKGFYGAGQEDQSRPVPFRYDADHPAVLVGQDQGPTPVEFLLHALAACLTAGIANIAAARGVTLESVECSVEGDLDLQGILGLSDKVRNGFRAIRVGFKVKGDAPAEKLRQIVEQSRARSAVFDILTNGVPVDVTAQVG